MKKLNFGSGEFPKEGFINMDILPHADVVHNLDQFPYPFDGQSFDHLEGDHVLEHLHDPFLVMEELYRIAKPGAEIVIRVPHFSRGFTHPDHKRGFDVTFPSYFNPEFKGGYTGTPLALKSLRMTWFAQPYLKRQELSPFSYYLGSGLGSIFSFLANLSPIICSRFWCFWVGGFEEVEFRFIRAS